MSGIGQETNNIRYVTAGTSLITMADDIINCDSAEGAIILVLPNIQGSGILSTGKCFKINDTANTAATHNITLVGTGGNKINDGATVTISTNGQSGYVKCLGLNDYLYDSPSSGMIGGFVGGSGTVNYLSKWTPDGVTIGNSQIFDNGTNVGVGTTVSSFKLGVETKIDGDGIALTFNKTNLGAIQKSNVDFNGYLGLYEKGVQATVLLGKQTFVPNSFINDGKNLGIGLTTPTAKLHVQGVDSTASNYALKADDLTGNALLYVRNDGASLIQNSLVVNSMGDNGLISNTTFGIVNNKASAFAIYNGVYSKFVEVLSNGHSLFGSNANDIAFVNIKGDTSDSTAKALQIQNTSNIDLLIVRNDGVVSIPSLPTSATGLSAGDLWVDTSAGNVVKMV